MWAQLILTRQSRRWLSNFTGRRYNHVLFEKCKSWGWIFIICFGQEIWLPATWRTNTPRALLLVIRTYFKYRQDNSQVHKNTEKGFKFCRQRSISSTKLTISCYFGKSCQKELPRISKFEIHSYWSWSWSCNLLLIIIVDAKTSMLSRGFTDREQLAGNPCAKNRK